MGCFFRLKVGLYTAANPTLFTGILPWDFTGKINWAETTCSLDCAGTERMLVT